MFHGATASDDAFRPRSLAAAVGACTNIITSRCSSIDARHRDKALQPSSVDRLTIFADNLVPHVLRLDGVLVYDDALAAAIDAQQELPAGSVHERELRACAVHACEQLAAKAGVPPRTLDNWLWNRGQHAPYSDRPAHVTKTVFY